MNIEKFKVPVSMLAPTIDPGQLGFEDTGELEPRLAPDYYRSLYQ